jgi:SseB protein N-terminal domain/SseB protein C-terminal domain
MALVHGYYAVPDQDGTIFLGAEMSLFKNLFRKPGSPENPALERAMHDLARNDNARTRESLYKAILASTFIMQGNVSGGTEARNGKRIADASTRIGFKTVEHPPGNIVLPVFTSLEALTSWAGSEVQWIALGAQELFQSISPGQIAEVRVNPFRPAQKVSRPGGIITRSEFLALAQGLLPESMISNNTAQLKVAAGQKVFIGKPADVPPTKLLTKLTDYFQEIPELRGAYLFQMANQNVTSRVIGLYFASEPNAQRMQQIMQGVGDITRGEIPTGESIDFMPLKTGPVLESVQNCGIALLEK